MHHYTEAHLQPASEMAGELKTMSSVLFVINCDICQKESRTCKHFREKWPTCLVLRLLSAWVKVFRINPEFRISRLSLKILNYADFDSFSD